ncbi:hypothetical protein NHH82_04525 [Oxalobacteraceae bacterium OTU3REALA1]|nr:hypothetical protein NHH82_04525 [Oxalobacteraceae bacterium OTU3REALA1]
MRAINQQELAMVSGGGEVGVEGGEPAVVVISYPHEDLHSDGLMGTLEMMWEFLTGGGGARNLQPEEIDLPQ